MKEILGDAFRCLQYKRVKMVYENFQGVRDNNSKLNPDETGKGVIKLN